MRIPEGFKPMLAATLEKASDAHLLSFPAYSSGKIDGVRAMTDLDGAAFSRKGEPFANRYLADEFLECGIPIQDGELGLGNPLDPAFFNRTSGFTRREDDNFTAGPIDYYVFDMYGSGGYEERFINRIPELEDIFARANERGKIRFQIHEYRKILDEEMFTMWENYFVDKGWEGIMVRCNLTLPYKYGRATLTTDKKTGLLKSTSGQLTKCKRFIDTEGVIIGFEEAEKNTNEAQTDAWGRTKRSNTLDAKEGKGMMGVMIVQSPEFKDPVRLGTFKGLTHEDRIHIWENQDEYLGKIVTYKYQGGNTDYEQPRFGSFQGFRYDLTLEQIKEEKQGAFGVEI